MKNITTNESLRNKWNAKENKKRRAVPVSCCERMKYLYWRKSSPSRVEAYYHLEKTTAADFYEHKLRLQYGIASSDDLNARERVNNLLRENKLDNISTLKEYGIDLNTIDNNTAA